MVNQYEQKTDEILVRSQTRMTILREEKRKTQNQVAKEMNFSPTSIKNWETGYKKPSYQNYLRMAAYYNVSFEYISGIEERECRQTKNVNISKETGLTEKSIEILRRFVEYSPDSFKGINFLLEKLYEEYSDSELTQESDNILTALYKLSHTDEYVESVNWLDPRRGVVNMNNQWFSINKDIVEEFCFRNKYKDIKALNNLIYPK